MDGVSFTPSIYRREGQIGHLVEACQFGDFDGGDVDGMRERIAIRHIAFELPFEIFRL